MCDSDSISDRENIKTAEENAQPPVKKVKFQGDQNADYSKMPSPCAGRLLHDTQASDLSHRVDIKKTLRNQRAKRYRDKHREEINQRLRDKQNQKNLQPTASCSNLHSIKPVPHDDDSSKRVDKSALKIQRQRRYRERHKEQINQRKRENWKRKQNVQPIATSSNVYSIDTIQTNNEAIPNDVPSGSNLNRIQEITHSFNSGSQQCNTQHLDGTLHDTQSSDSSHRQNFKFIKEGSTDDKNEPDIKFFHSEINIDENEMLKGNEPKRSDENAYTCDNSAEKFSRKSDRIVPRSRIHGAGGAKLYKCGSCGSELSTRSGLRAHLKIHTGEKPHECEYCGSRFLRRFHLTAHLRIHTGERPYECDDCVKKFPRKSELTVHRARIHRAEEGVKPYKCGSRGTESSTGRERLIARAKVYATEKPPPPSSYKCVNCGREFLTDSKLTAHSLRVHTVEKRYKCDNCESTFALKSNLINHLSVHNAEKPYKCDDCAKNFRRKFDLANHSSVHTGAKPYTCDNCASRFSSKSTLINHSRIHTGAKLYECDYCAKKFLRKSALSVHSSVHTGAKLYECDNCAKEFSERAVVIRHLKIHAGAKPHKCDSCVSTFRRKSDLIVHSRVHTGAKPYKCDDCAKAFAQRSGLIRHLRIHAGATAAAAAR